MSQLGQEYFPEDEQETIKKLVEIFEFLMRDYQFSPSPRTQHPKSHGYVQGEFIIEENMSDQFKVGIFSKPQTYPIWVRFSNGSGASDETGNFQPDTTGDIRGVSIKLLGVKGCKAFENSAPDEQDFIAVNTPIFFLRDAKAYLDFFPIVNGIREGKIIMNADGSPKQIPDELKASYEAIAYSLPLLNQVRSQVMTSPLEANYWSATPYKFGNTAMKYAIFPHLEGEKFNIDTAEDKTNYLREAMTKYLATKDAYFDFCIQQQTDAEKMPIEDPTVLWDEKESPFIKVATMRIFQQEFNSQERIENDEKQSFSPWNCLQEYRPLGGVNRARKIYADMADFRNEINQK
ncbi:catalase family protein [Cyanothece sp. BG0011]|uniref:catalase family protein n=1 Tax=Cyanothece sp. BG0011 TaxID=2082950 RepID=UPI000D1F6632|nr:catalase family protein [Cyanothece sp. BG0011]